MSTHGMDVAVVGGSIGGLFAAAMLRREGHRVQVFEKSVHGLRARGAGLVAQQEIFTALDAAGIAPGAVPSVTSTERITLDLGGVVRYREHAEQMQLSWDRLYDALRASIPEADYHLAAAVLDVRTVDDGVEFDTPTNTHRAELLVGADGAHSAVRAFVAPEHRDPRYVGYAIWRGLVDENDVPADAADTLFRRMTFYTGPGEHALGYLVPGIDGGTAPGTRRYNWVWYRSLDAGELASLMVSAGRRPTDTSLAPGQAVATTVAELRMQARRRLPPQLAAVVELEERPFLQAVLDYVAPRFARERAVLLGDAGAVVRPHTAMGAAKAAGDALALARTMHEASVPLALARYEHLRLPVARDIARYGVTLGRNMPL